MRAAQTFRREEERGGAEDGPNFGTPASSVRRLLRSPNLSSEWTTQHADAACLRRGEPRRSTSMEEGCCVCVALFVSRALLVGRGHKRTAVAAVWWRHKTPHAVAPRTPDRCPPFRWPWPTRAPSSCAAASTRRRESERATRGQVTAPARLTCSFAGVQALVPARRHGRVAVAGVAARVGVMGAGPLTPVTPLSPRRRQRRPRDGRRRCAVLSEERAAARNAVAGAWPPGWMRGAGCAVRGRSLARALPAAAAPRLSRPPAAAGMGRRGQRAARRVAPPGLGVFPRDRFATTRRRSPQPPFRFPRRIPRLQRVREGDARHRARPGRAGADAGVCQLHWRAPRPLSLPSALSPLPSLSRAHTRAHAHA